MDKVIILISTRRYSPDLKNFVDIQTNSLDEFVVVSNVLNDEDLRKIKTQCKRDTEKEKGLYAPMKRKKVWEHDYASYNDTDYSSKGIKIRKTSNEIVDGDTQYVIYVAPCTNGNLGPEYQLEYTKKLLEIVKKDSGNAQKYYLIVHDKDISETPGHGICASVNGFNTYKFQHEDGDPIYSSVIKAITAPSSEVCKEICLIVDNAPKSAKEMMTLAQMNSSEATAAAYEELIPKV